MHLLHRSAVSFALAACASLALAAPQAHADVTGADIVGFVNAQRAANGLPAGITEDTAASAACAAWASGTPPGTLAPGATYTNSPNLGGPGSWTATNDPFEQRPFVLPYLLAPRLAALGAAEIGGTGCATAYDAPQTGPAPTHDVTYSYPGDGAQDVRTSMVAAGGVPIAPSPQAQVPSPRETGPYLYAFFDGPDFDPAHPASTKVTAAALTGPDGAVPVDTYDSTTPGFPTVLPSEVQVVPHDALKPFARYTASVTADVTVADGAPPRSFTRTWSFTTGALENGISMFGWGNLGADKSKVSFEVYSRAPQVTATATGPGTPASGTGVSPLATYIGGWITLQLDRPGTWHVCFRSGGAGTDFRPAELCKDVVAGAVPPVVTPPTPVVPKPAKLVVSVAHGSEGRLHGRTLSVPLRCSAACSLKVAAKVTAKGRHAMRLRTVTVARKSAGTVTVKYTLSKAVARRLRSAHARRLALTIVPKGAATVRRTVAIGAK